MSDASRAQRAAAIIVELVTGKFRWASTAWFRVGWHHQLAFCTMFTPRPARSGWNGSRDIIGNGFSWRHPIPTMGDEAAPCFDFRFDLPFIAWLKCLTSAWAKWTTLAFSGLSIRFESSITLVWLKMRQSSLLSAQLNALKSNQLVFEYPRINPHNRLWSKIGCHGPFNHKLARYTVQC